MPNNTLEKWEEKTLGEITVSVCNGTSAQQCKKITNYPVTRIETIATSKINLDKVGYIDGCSEDFVNKYKMEYGDILFSNINSDIHLGKTAIYEIPKGILLHGMNLLRIRVNKTFVTPFYLNYYFIYLRFLGSFIRMASRSVNQSSINQTKLKALKILLPPLSEQERIVAKLDKSFEAIDKVKANAEQNLTNAKELFNDTLDSKIRTLYKNSSTQKLSEVCDVRDGTHDSPKYLDKRGHPFVTSKNLKNDKIDMEKITYISDSDFEKINERSKVDIGDVLFAMIGTIGNPVVITEEPDFAIKNVALFKNINKLEPQYLKFLLKSPSVLLKMQLEANGTTQKFVSLKYLRNFMVPVPSLSEQQKIVEKLDALQEQTKQLEAIYTQKIKECDELKQSILQKAFRGEL